MQFYVHSGRLGKGGVLWAVVWGLFAGLLLCRYYVRALGLLPVAYANPLIAAAYGYAVGWASGFGAKLGNLRNVPVARLLGGLIGLAAVYFAWAYTPMTRLGVFDGPIWDFETLWDYAKLAYEQGTWPLWPGGPTFGGVPLVVVWLAEAVIVVGVAARTAGRWLADRPFCEETQQWMKREPNVARLSLAGEGAEAKLERLMAGDMSVLGELPRITGREPPFLQLDLASVETCSFCKFLTVTLTQQVANEKGRVHTRKARLLDKLQVSADDLPLIRGADTQRAADANP
jgi:hypothetical protein